MTNEKISITTLGDNPGGRLLYIDNIRIFLTVLVIVHHLMVTYSGNGSWIYLEGREDDVTYALGGWFTGVNQSYFMSLFLFISAYFVPGSYERKGPQRFIKDRIIRLGIPLIFYGWVLRPVLIYFGYSLQNSFWSWYPLRYMQDFGVIGGGPLWFIEVLLIFSILYTIWRVLIPSPLKTRAQDSTFPGRVTIILASLLVGSASFIVRLFFPVGTSYQPLNLQIPFFVPYIVLFILGLQAEQRGWLTHLTDKDGRFWLRSSILLILLYPVIGVLAGSLHSEEFFMGGWHWQSWIFSTWEAAMAFSMSIGLLSLFRRRWNQQGKLSSVLSRNAYAAYLIHEPVIAFLAFAASPMMLHPMIKFVLASIIFIPICFALSSIVLRLPYADRVL